MIKFFGKPKNPENKEKTVLFVCVENSGRSQMAEGLFRKYAPRDYTALSAGKISMAHFNPAVTLSFLITKHITKIQLVYYLAAEIIGALFGSLFVKYTIGNEANLGANAPNYAFPIPIICGTEVLATALLMAVILTVVHTRGLRGFSGIVIGGMVGLDIFFLGIVSGASMNPARSLAPDLLSGGGSMSNLWLYWTATFIGTSIVAFVYRINFVCRKKDVFAASKF